MSISYILPVRWDSPGDTEEMAAYLRSLSPYTDLVVVDGSPEALFRKHEKAWGKYARHIRPHADFAFLNGKVNGVLTGLREVQHEYVVIADDDVRYRPDQLEQMQHLLTLAHMVVPQNYFDPNPWHGKWDTARSLLNRALSHDYPGTLGIQRSFITQLGGYDGNVLFENLEMIRTVQAGKGNILYRNDFYVRRLPPTAKHFWSQRIRQAYDDHAQPLRFLFFLLLLPLLVKSSQKLPWVISATALASIGVAEIGRRKVSGEKVFSPVCSFFAPVWLLERGICSWLAMGQKLLKGGCLYGDVVIPRAANPLRRLRQGMTHNC